ncbi:hypothetical protein P3L10_026233 [Capsicum annuum]
MSSKSLNKNWLILAFLMIDVELRFFFFALESGHLHCGHGVLIVMVTYPPFHPNVQPNFKLSCADSSLSTKKYSTTFGESDTHMLALDNNISNHKILKSNSKDSSGHSSDSLNNHLKPKSWTSSSVLDSSCTPLTKSKNQHGNPTMVKVKKVPHNKGNKEFNKEVDVKRGCVNLSKSQDIERFKEFDEIKKQSLLALQFKNGGRRKSFCSSKIELGDFFICSGVKVVSLDMPPFMQIHAINRARKTHDSLEKFIPK